MVQQTLEEWVRRNRESTLMEGRKGNDVAIGRRRRILAAGHKPLCRIDFPTEKTTLDEALYAHVGDVRAMS